MGSELSFLNLGFEHVQDVARAKRESLEPQEDNLGSHHDTASSSSAPSPHTFPKWIQMGVLNLAMKGIWKISNQPQIRLNSVEILK